MKVGTRKAEGGTSKPVGAARSTTSGSAIWFRLAPSAFRLFLLLFVTGTVGLRAAEIIPAKPTRYFNDSALMVKPETAERLNRALEDLEKQSSNQILAVIYPKMQSDSSLDDYCERVFRTWQVGQKDKNNGAVLFVFVADHKSRIQTGYGLEGSLPDAICKRILSDEMAPYFKANDFDGGMIAGVEAMIKATRNEYKGAGLTKYQQEHPAGSNGGSGGISFGTIFFLFIVGYFIFSMFTRRRGGAMYTGGGPIFFGGGFGGGGGGFGGGDSGGGGGFSDGGGGFSSGGGDSGGGGASGDW